MEQYVLFKGSKRVTLKDDDMSAEKIGRIFQVSSQTLYLTDDSNIAIFPAQSGFFSVLDFTARGHYEVHGDEVEKGVLTPGTPLSTPAASQRFSFTRNTPPSAAAGSPAAAVAGPPKAAMTRSFQRSIYIADLVNGKLRPSRMVVVRFMECEATVHGIIGKVQDALGSYDPVILTDVQGNEILDSEGTKGSIYWKQNARKVFAIAEHDFTEYQGSKRKRSSSRKDDETSSLQDVYDKIEEVVLASQGLQQVISNIKELSELSSQTPAKTLTEVQTEKIKAAFTCIVCKGPIDQPVFATCCRSLIGCKLCVDQWMATSSQCLKCREEALSNHIFLAAGLSEALLALGDIIRVE
ncbi:uncharacterized protein LOC130424974 [Triplophysa dalaica]|uniref:uncharacterized protein LOC130424974 n=1 Tax=Triplophysa dalaica TaxID=1582913 RepID=UPI0024DFB1F0|nr:uncharacterized protein LOC130424974 [Triplophysa dalaica]XP_056606975.1 uncharacterized protein LOC130424974 [Triplophysa dalaica]